MNNKLTGLGANHPANGPLTTGRLIHVRNVLQRHIKYSNGGSMDYIIADAVKAIDELLAGRKAEPVAWTEKCEISNMQATGLYLRGFPDNSQGRDIALYTSPPAPVTIDERAAFNAWNNEDNLPIAGVGAKNAAWLAWQARAKLGSPPAPVVPEEATPKNIEMLASTRVDSSVSFQWDEDERNAAADSWNACRAAMLQGSQPVSNRDELREKVRREHAEWSDATFGDVGPVGPLKHLSKEALEAAADQSDSLEWADMQFLLWDAQRRMGLSDEFITRAMIEKLEINRARQWPEPKDGEPRLHIKTVPKQENI